MPGRSICWCCRASAPGATRPSTAGTPTRSTRIGSSSRPARPPSRPWRWPASPPIARASTCMSICTKPPTPTTASSAPRRLRATAWRSNGTPFPTASIWWATPSDPSPAFQRALIDAVRRVTHIAKPDEHGRIIGAALQQEGVINLAKRSSGLCGGMTDARFVTTTEVYPGQPDAARAVQRGPGSDGQGGNRLPQAGLSELVEEAVHRSRLSAARPERG